MESSPRVPAAALCVTIALTTFIANPSTSSLWFLVPAIIAWCFTAGFAISAVRSYQKAKYEAAFRLEVHPNSANVVGTNDWELLSFQASIRVDFVNEGPLARGWGVALELYQRTAIHTWKSVMRLEIPQLIVRYHGEELGPQQSFDIPAMSDSVSLILNPKLAFFKKPNRIPIYKAKLFITVLGQNVAPINIEVKTKMV